MRSKFMQPHILSPRYPGWKTLLFTASLWLAGCASQAVTENVPPPQIADLTSPKPVGDSAETALDWPGTYQALLPCHDCAGIAISVQLRADRTAVVRERRVGGNLDKAVEPSYTGPFSFDPAGGSMISLRRTAHAPIAYRFFVAEDWIEMRESSTGASLSPHNMYRLRKTSLPAQ
ncbi:copper resistance protein NlpE N-terminal domain-containing protein [Comamonas sp. NoAH]|uniref:copper resistance protein NlpE N-terminal domain-containing protein n=1 Tax=Comamonas halotolerans TaxID=3041496 RepID=UPI0024E1377A|nr:copper resistance protein NlpE N-terminal domain-containing protein [Comamonas sp. NoAH]